MTRPDSARDAAIVTEDQFPAFFEEVHGWAPFPWQRSLFRQVVDQGWPSLIDVPTGLGKTAVLDVAVFAAAVKSKHARRRVFLVVDRRLIVDQAYEHAVQIRRAIKEAPDGTICHAVGERLRAEGDDGDVLDVTRMRGGVDWSWLWLERPDRYGLVTGTVDQVGSRLLFRGYGVGDQLKSIDAALTGTDSLIIVDEAHLSEAFLSTLRDISALEEIRTVPAPIVVAMSASPDGTGQSPHRISASDEQDPIAGRRLRAEKTVRLVTAPRVSENAASATADVLAYWGLELGGLGKVTGVIVNTVSMARAVFSKLRATVPDPGDCVLLTGRIRPVDREYLYYAWYPRIRAGGEREDDKAIYVVATQTIEVGADIDLDALVTESASLPALVQRLGRVNRRGTRPGDAIVVHVGGSFSIYGSARQQTWDWLASMAEPIRHRAGQTVAQLGQSIDGSPKRLRDLVQGVPAELAHAMTGSLPYAPVVSDVTLDTWTRTSPRPHPDVPVGPYLHGVGADYPTVSILWRADMHNDDPDQWHRTVDRVPPSASEAIELPIAAAQLWLAGLPRGSSGGGALARATSAVSVPVSDLETPLPELPAQDADARSAIYSGPQVLRYRGADGAETIALRNMRPGDLIVVPATWGGCDRYGWDPDSAEPVIDVGDLTGGSRRRMAAIRVGPTLAAAMRSLAWDAAEAVEQLISTIETDIKDEDIDQLRYRDILRRVAASFPERGTGSDLPHERVLRSLASGVRLTVLDQATTGDGVLALLSRRGVSWNDDASVAGTSVTSESRSMTLAVHQKAVGIRAAQFASNLGLPDPVVRAVRFAAEHHDEGKRDRRFQIMLHRGDQWMAHAVSEPLAKSGMDPADRAAFRLAQRLSGYPSGMRHEALSARVAAFVLEHDKEDLAIDADLVRHLIASHHGYSRPLLPPIADPGPVEVEFQLNGTLVKLVTDETVDWDSPERFVFLGRNYGRWGLALLEAVVRLADIWCSARSEEGQ